MPPALNRLNFLTVRWRTTSTFRMRRDTADSIQNSRLGVWCRFICICGTASRDHAYSPLHGCASIEWWPNYCMSLDSVHRHIYTCTEKIQRMIKIQLYGDLKSPRDRRYASKYVIDKYLTSGPVRSVQATAKSRAGAYSWYLLHRKWFFACGKRREHKTKREEEKTRKNICISGGQNKGKLIRADNSDLGTCFHFPFRAAARRCRKSTVIYTFVVSKNIEHRKPREFRSEEAITVLCSLTQKLKATSRRKFN